jgi:hypothetical protein
MNGMDFHEIKNDKDEADDWMKRVCRYLDWDENAGNRRIKPNVVSYWNKRIN